MLMLLVITVVVVIVTVDGNVVGISRGRRG